MTKKEFREKYDSAIREVATAYSCDMFEGEDRIKYEARVKAGEVKREDTYTMPEGLDLDEVFKDMCSITD